MLCAWTPALDKPVMEGKMAPDGNGGYMQKTESSASMRYKPSPQSDGAIVCHGLTTGSTAVAKRMTWLVRLTRIYPEAGNCVTLIIPESQ